MLVPDSFWHSDLLSVQMRMLVWGAQCSLIHSVANSIAHASSSYEHVSLRPRCMILSTVIGFSVSPMVITAAAPPSRQPPLADPSV